MYSCVCVYERVPVRDGKCVCVCVHDNKLPFLRFMTFTCNELEYLYSLQILFFFFKNYYFIFALLKLSRLQWQILFSSFILIRMYIFVNAIIISTNDIKLDNYTINIEIIINCISNLKQILQNCLVLMKMGS